MPETNPLNEASDAEIDTALENIGPAVTEKNKAPEKAGPDPEIDRLEKELRDLETRQKKLGERIRNLKNDHEKNDIARKNSRQSILSLMNLNAKRIAEVNDEIERRKPKEEAA